MSKSMLEEIGLDQALDIMSKATAKAARRADDLGLPHAVEVQGEWMLQYPDGRLKPFASGAETSRKRQS